jgi:hypothetical protein
MNSKVSRSRALEPDSELPSLVLSTRQRTVIDILALSTELHHRRLYSAGPTFHQNLLYMLHDLEPLLASFHLGLTDYHQNCPTLPVSLFQKNSLLYMPMQ